jgi:D,D-heptose 1,7-bisphosphate phosphatase
MADPRDPITQAVILAGGKGTRLAAALGREIPKPMAPVAGVPLIERLIRLLAAQGIREIVLLVHHRADVIREWCGDGGKYGLKIVHVEEGEPLGTGGALRDAVASLQEEFLVLYGDTLVDMDFGRLIAFHRESDADLTVFAHPNDHPHDSDLIERAPDGRVLLVHPYPHPAGEDHQNLVNAALYVMKRSLLESRALPSGSFDIAKDALPAWIGEGCRIFAYRGDGYIKDMGTPERLAAVEADIASGMSKRKSGRDPRPAVFLDRDGTVNVEKGHLSRAVDFELLPGVGGAIRRLNRAGVLAIVITNQPVVARGGATFEDIERIHRRMESLLATERAFLDGIFYCPHHPDCGFEGERLELKIDCRCRKPGTELIDRACSIFSIARRSSWFIGDRTGDIECARRAGLRSILVATGAAGADGKYPVEPDRRVADLAAAVEVVLAGEGGFSL